MDHTIKARLVTELVAALEQRLGASQGLDQDVRTAVDAAVEAIPGLQTRRVTILLSDLRGFTALSERFNTIELVEMLNGYFRRMSEIILESGGTIDKFMGDGIMALFGVPEPGEDDMGRALACAIRMQQAMDGLNAEHRESGLPQLYMGIGINTGDVVAGNIGSAAHSEFTVIGDHVNLASRVESYALRGQILISENCYAVARDRITVGNVNEVRVKGRTGTVNLYELLELKDPHLVAPRHELRRSPRVQIDAPIVFRIVEQKVVGDTVHRGRLADLGYGGMLFESPVELEANAEIRVTLSPSMMSDETTEIYARVVVASAKGTHWDCKCAITAIDEMAQRAIKETVDRLVMSGMRVDPS